MSAHSSSAIEPLHRVALAALEGADLLRGQPTLHPLAGGVSNDVVVVRTGNVAFVVKRALPRLRVEEVWEASADRSFTEAEALRWAGTISPEAVPQVFAVDRSHNVIVIELAPDSHENWKERVLDGDVRPGVGARLGSLLAGWHTASAADSGLLAEFDDQEAFAQLRVTPFYRVAADRNPLVAPVIHDLADQLAGTRTALVHGDFSPKNILVDRHADARLWVIDWEVAHTGDPAFDVAFLLHHLVCKQLARPVLRERLQETAERFLTAYGEGTRDSLGLVDRRYLLAHTGALVLARVDGKSPVDYFTPDQRDAARRLALTVLSDVPDRLDRLWSLTDAH